MSLLKVNSIHSQPLPLIYYRVVGECVIKFCSEILSSIGKKTYVSTKTFLSKGWLASKLFTCDVAFFDLICHSIALSLGDPNIWAEI